MSIVENPPKRLLIYTHYNPQNLLSAYVLFALEKLNPLYERVVFVSNSQVSSKHREQLSEYTDEIIQRKNKGFDFGAWRDAIFQEGWENIQEYEYLTLMNDTCYGPMQDLKQVFNKMEEIDADYWGITSHTELNIGFWKFGRNIAAHLQSYFVSYSKQILQNDAFQSFWKNVEDLADVKEVIDEYEIGISRILSSEGFSHAAYLPADTFPKNVRNNVAFHHPQLLIDRGSPFIKIKSIFLFKHPGYLKDLVEKHTDYSFSFIEEHITQSFLPNKSLKVLDKNYLLPETDPNEESSLRIAVHLHVYYTDGVSRFLSDFEQIVSKLDLYITTDSHEKKEFLERKIEEYTFERSRIKIIVTENRGRDVLPWLRISDQLESYDVVGHFHVKKSIHADEWMAKAWMDDLRDSLLSKADSIFKLFETDENLGIVIPDIPYFFKSGDLYLPTDDRLSEADERDYLLDLWSKLDVKKTIDRESIFKPIMSYGTMFWYRPEALEPLMDVEKFNDGFLSEPLPEGDRYPHSFERAVVYVAWSNNYDFRVVFKKDAVFSGFDVHNRSGIQEFSEKFFSTSAWKVGRSLTWIPWKVKRFFRKRIHVNEVDPEST